MIQEVITRKENDTLYLPEDKQNFYWALCKGLTKTRNMQPGPNSAAFSCTQIWIPEAKVPADIKLLGAILENHHLLK